MTDPKTVPCFIIDPAPTIKWPVTVRLPADGGEVAEFRFTGEFKRLSEEELDKLLGSGDPAKAEEKDPKRLAQILEENAALFPKLLVGWEGVKKSDGADVPFTFTTLDQQITGPNGPFLSAGLWRAIAEIRNGARLGN